MKVARLRTVFGAALAIVASGLVLFVLADSVGLLSKGPSLATVSPAAEATSSVSASSVPIPSATVSVAVEPDPSDDFIVESTGGSVGESAGGSVTKKCRQLRVMPLGDSLTSFPQSYRGPLFRALFTQNINVDFVGSMREKPKGGGDPDHEGHGGFTIGPDAGTNLSDNVERWITDAKPDVIILTIGTNDMAGGSELQSAAPARYLSLVKKIQNVAPSAVLVLHDLPPAGTYQRGFQPQVALDAAAKRLGRESASDLVLYAATRDAFDRLGYKPTVDIQNDKIHLSVAGGKKFALALLPTVRDAIVLAEKKRAC